jgi:hypothetical protein
MIKSLAEGVETMQLRDHPLMHYRGIPNWPPRWHGRGDGTSPHVHGEIGILTEVTVYAPPGGPPQLFLFMENHGSRYIAAVLFSDRAFCRQIGGLLKNYYGQMLEEIGGLDVSGLL